MKSSSLRVILFVIIAGIVGYLWGIYKITLDWQNYHPQLSIVNQEPPAGMQTMDMAPFWTVAQAIETNFYDRKAINGQNMVNGAISGMISTLNDPFTMYLPPTNNTAFKQQISGQFQGIGAELTTNNKQVLIMAPLDGSPAQKAGLKSGDIIEKVNGQDITGMDLNTVVNMIKGPKGTQVTLTILPKGSNNAKDIIITRDNINVKTVSSWVKAIKDIPTINASASALLNQKNEQIAYIRLSEFGEQTDQEWSPVVNNLALQLKKNSNIKGVVLDLRENPGGLLTDALYIASEFLPQGATVVKQEDAYGNIKALTVDRAGVLQNVPMVVLIDGGSASASEIVSGALRDNNRAKLVGEKSFGKGTVQDAEDLGNGAGLHVTIAKWLTPNGTWVGNGKNGTGLHPDVTAALNPKDPTHDTQLEAGIETLLQE